jgi:lysophospholipase L1-like esterase
MSGRESVCPEASAFSAGTLRALCLSVTILSSSLGCGHDPLESPGGGEDVDAHTADDDSNAQVVDAASKSADAATARTTDAAARLVDSGRGDSSHQDAGAALEADSGWSGPSDAGGRQSPGEAGTERVRDAGGFPPLTANVTLHVAGDSTSAIFPESDPTHRVGWAAVLQAFFTDGVKVDDAAQSGRSSKSYLDEGLWKSLKAKIRPGDYVFVEFGHNDEKSEDAARYTDPATTFRSNLKTYVTETRAAGGIAVLLTPISRRQFSGSKIVASHGAYPAAVAAVAAETGTPLIDMTERTRVWLEGIGPTASVSFFATDDNTHLSAKGAQEVAKLAVQGLRELGLPLAERLVP